ncbi:hypothetical protein G1C95_1153 [Bifidobacterium sp. DSM 109957]|uniref:Uncharacterized protein n=2 Tax=Bifidobacterium oedipodis TaxID=2675322 RepID=A0A7Y0EPC9_9BIFI|nr:hypothetical protein [Bifidobacterium sp. DSM 109957]
MVETIGGGCGDTGESKHCVVHSPCPRHMQSSIGRTKRFPYAASCIHPRQHTLYIAGSHSAIKGHSFRFIARDDATLGFFRSKDKSLHTYVTFHGSTLAKVTLQRQLSGQCGESL